MCISKEKRSRVWMGCLGLEGTGKYFETTLVYSTSNSAPLDPRADDSATTISFLILPSCDDYCWWPHFNRLWALIWAISTKKINMIGWATFTLASYDVLHPTTKVGLNQQISPSNINHYVPANTNIPNLKERQVFQPTNYDRPPVSPLRFVSEHLRSSTTCYAIWSVFCFCLRPTCVLACYTSASVHQPYPIGEQHNLIGSLKPSPDIWIVW